MYTDKGLLSTMIKNKTLPNAYYYMTSSSLIFAINVLIIVLNGRRVYAAVKVYFGKLWN